jgi:hypothetical protein
MKQALRYVFKVWLTTSLVPPIFYILAAFIWERDSVGYIWMLPVVYTLIAISSCVISLPTLAVFYSITVGVQRLTLTFRSRLVLIVITSQVLIIATFVLFLTLFPGFTKQSYYCLMVVDCLVMAYACWRYRNLLRLQLDSSIVINE